jgi:hypothetical protein
MIVGYDFVSQGWEAIGCDKNSWSWSPNSIAPCNNLSCVNHLSEVWALVIDEHHDVKAISAQADKQIALHSATAIDQAERPIKRLPPPQVPMVFRG